MPLSIVAIDWRHESLGDIPVPGIRTPVSGKGLTVRQESVEIMASNKLLCSNWKTMGEM